MAGKSYTGGAVADPRPGYSEAARAVKVGFVQTSPIFGQVERNVGRALELAADSDADLLVLPELLSTGYSFRDRGELAGLAEDRNGPTVQAFVDLCSREDRWIVGGWPEQAPEGCYNSAFLVGPAGLLGVYRKVHLFLDEKDLFLPGDLGFEVWDIGPCRVGMMVCFDWSFPEAARSLALRGAQVIAHPSNLVLPHCQRAMVTRSLENRVFTVTANRVGREERTDRGPLVFTGGSQLLDPRGELLAGADTTSECQASAEVELALAEDKQLTPRNHVFDDRRPALYRFDRQ